MSLTINTLKDAADAGGIRVIVDRRLWVTADKSRAVEDGDPEARFLLCAPGKPVLRSELERLGIKIKAAGEEKAGKKRDKAAGEEKAGKKRDKAPTEDKSDKKPAEDKGGIPGNVKAAKATIAAAADPEALDALIELEAAREDGPRTGVNTALVARAAELEN